MTVVVYAQDLSGRRDDGHYTKPDIAAALEVFFSPSDAGNFIDAEAGPPTTEASPKAAGTVPPTAARATSAPPQIPDHPRPEAPTSGVTAASERGPSTGGTTAAPNPDRTAPASGKPAPGAPVAPTPGLTVIHFHNSHLVYAITWYTLALMTAIAIPLGMRKQ